MGRTVGRGDPTGELAGAVLGDATGLGEGGIVAAGLPESSDDGGGDPWTAGP